MGFKEINFMEDGKLSEATDYFYSVEFEILHGFLYDKIRNFEKILMIVM